jgi:hypothetical protein
MMFSNGRYFIFIQQYILQRFSSPKRPADRQAITEDTELHAHANAHRSDYAYRQGDEQEFLNQRAIFYDSLEKGNGACSDVTVCLYL